MQDTLPHNAIFELVKKLKSQLMCFNGMLYALGEDSIAENFYSDPRGSYPLKEIVRISKIEELYTTKFSKQIEEWKNEKIKRIKSMRKGLDYSKEEHELLKFIVKGILSNFGICGVYEEKTKVENSKKEKFNTIWDKMVNKVAPFGKYPEKVDEKKEEIGPKGRASVIENFSIWGDKIYPLVDEEKAPPYLIDETRFVQFNNKRYVYLNPISSWEVDELYQNALEMEINRDILNEMRSENVLEFETLRNFLEKFNLIHKDRGVIRNSPKDFTIFINSYPKFAMYCSRHRRYYLFETATLSSTLTRDGYTIPRITKGYKHPYVFSNGSICYGSFKPTHIPDDPGLELANWLMNGRDCLMVSPVDGIDEANPDHDTFMGVSLEEIKEGRTPITNFRRRWIKE